MSKKAFEDDELEQLQKEVESRQLKKTAQPIESKKVVAAKEEVKPSDEWLTGFGVNKNSEGKWELVLIKYKETGEARVHETVNTYSSEAVAKLKANEAIARLLGKLPLKSLYKKEK